MKRRLSWGRSSHSQWRSNKIVEIRLVEHVKKRTRLDVIQNIIDNFKIDLDKPDSKGMTSLMYAVTDDNSALIGSLLSAKVNVNAADHTGTTVLMHSVLKKSIGTVELLLKSGADVSPQNKSGNTALLLACKGKSPELVRLLISNGADVSVKNSDSETPLVSATLEDSHEIMKILIESSANVNDTDKHGETALFKIQNKESLMVLLAARPDLNVVNQMGNTVLKNLIKFALLYPDCIEIVMQNGADPLIPDKEGTTTLMEACNSVSFEYLYVVRMLLNAGLDPNVQNQHGMCALSYAVLNGHLETINILLSSGANLENPNEEGDTVLMQTCRHNYGENVQVLDLLIERGADVSSRNNKGQTALMHSVQNNQLEHSKLLLSKGANPSDRDNAGNSALFSVCDHENLQLLNLLIENGVNVSIQNNEGKTPLMVAFQRNHFDTLKVLIVHGANLTPRDGNGRDILMHLCAAHQEHPDLVQLIVERNSSLSSRSDAEGETALNMALGNRHFEILKMLIESSTGDLSVPDRNGNTILMKACSKGFTDIVELLLEKGVDLHVTNTIGKTAAMIAAFENKLDVLCLLIERGAVVTKNEAHYSVLMSLFKNRILNDMHPDFQLTLRKIIDFGVHGMNVVEESVTEYLKYCVHFHEDCVVNFLEFIRQMVGVAPIVPNDIQNQVMNIGEEHMCYAIELFDLIVESPLRNTTWHRQLSVFDLVHNFHSDMVKSDVFPCLCIGATVLSFHNSVEDFPAIRCDSYCPVLLSTLKKMLENGFVVADTHFLSPLSVVASLRSFHDPFLVKIASELISRNAQKSQRLLSFKCSEIDSLAQRLHLPDALWLAFQNAHCSLVRLLAPYWSAAPLSLFMFIPEYSEEYFDEMFCTLLEIGGPLPPGHPFIPCIQRYLDAYSQELALQFRKVHSAGPPSLKMLSRHVIRENAESSDNLPELLSSLVPFRLKKFISITD